MIRVNYGVDRKWLRDPPNDYKSSLYSAREISSKGVGFICRHMGRDIGCGCGGVDNSKLKRHGATPAMFRRRIRTFMKVRPCKSHGDPLINFCMELSVR